MDQQAKDSKELSVLVRHVPRIVVANFMSDPERLRGPKSSSFLAVMALFDISGFSSLASKLSDDEKDQMRHMSVSNHHDGPVSEQSLRSLRGNERSDASDEDALRNSRECDLARHNDTSGVARDLMHQRRRTALAMSQRHVSLISRPKPTAPQGIAVETLTTTLNRTLEPVIEVILQHGGDIIKFAGDAVIVLWETEMSLGTASAPGVLTYRAVKCALEALGVLACASSCDPNTSQLGMHIGIGVSQVTGSHVGGVLDRWEFYISGDANRQMSLAEGRANKGQVALSMEAYSALAASVAGHELANVRVQAAVLSDGVHVVSELSHSPYARTQPPALKPPRSLIPLLRCYVPGTIVSCLQRGLALTSCARPVTAVFIKLDGIIEIQDDTEQVQEIQRVLCIIQESVYKVQGTLRQFLIDDKGAVAIVVIGLPPFYHENNALRGVMLACYLQDKGIHTSIGVTTGTAFCGSIGSRSRAEYAVVGDIINLAARLMSAAGTGEILCDETTYEESRESIHFNRPQEILVKGKSAAVKIYGVHTDRRMSKLDSTDLVESAYAIPFGCESIVDVVPLFGTAALRPTIDTRGNNPKRVHRVLMVTGETGSGKTMLLRHYRYHRSRCFLGSGNSVDSALPLHAWSTIVREMLSRTVKTARPPPQRGGGESILARNDEAPPSLVHMLSYTSQLMQSMDDSIDGCHVTSNPGDSRAMGSLTSTYYRVPLLEYLVMKDHISVSIIPILNDLLPYDHLFQVDGGAFQQGEERTKALESIILSMLEALSMYKPILLMFDNGQWIDESSWCLLQRVLEDIPNVSALVATRSKCKLKSQSMYERIEQMDCTKRIELQRLSYQGTSLFLCQHYHIAIMDPQLLDFVFARAEGNPAETIRLVDVMLDANFIEVEQTTGSVKILSDLDDLDMHVPQYTRARVMACVDGLDAYAQTAVKIMSINPDPVEEKTLLSIIYFFMSSQRRSSTDVSDLRLKRSSKVSEIDHLRSSLAVCAHEAIISIDLKDKLYMFNSEEMRLVVYDMMLPSQREVIHMLYCRWFTELTKTSDRSVVATLDESALTLTKPHQQFAMLGYHLLRSGDPRLALETYQKAAELAIDVNELGFAADCMQSSHKILDDNPVNTKKNFNDLDYIMMRSCIEFIRGAIAIKQSEWDKAIAHMTFIIRLCENKANVLRRYSSSLYLTSTRAGSSIMLHARVPSSPNVMGPSLVMPDASGGVGLLPAASESSSHRLSLLSRFRLRIMNWRGMLPSSYLSSLKSPAAQLPLGKPSSPLGRRVTPEETLTALNQVQFYRKKAAMLIKTINDSKRKQQEMAREIQKLTHQSLKKTKK